MKVDRWQKTTLTDGVMDCEWLWAIRAAEDAKWVALLRKTPSWCTDSVCEVRFKALKAAKRQPRTVLNRLTPKITGSINRELATALDETGP